jgi:predicted nucleic acid-binding protein
MRIALGSNRYTDLWIAAPVIQHDLTLRARDKHFDHIAPVVSRVEALCVRWFNKRGRATLAVHS